MGDGASFELLAMLRIGPSAMLRIGNNLFKNIGNRILEGLVFRKSGFCFA